MVTEQHVRDIYSQLMSHGKGIWCLSLAEVIHWLKQFYGIEASESDVKAVLNSLVEKKVLRKYDDQGLQDYSLGNRKIDYY
jgi:predicted transcriptional regulator